jgi:uncharacterized membrane protein
VLILTGAVVSALAASRSPLLAKLDRRVLGRHGVAILAAVVTALMLIATIAAVADGAWAIAAVYAAMTLWVGYTAVRRIWDLPTQ